MNHAATVISAAAIDDGHADSRAKLVADAIRVGFIVGPTGVGKSAAAMTLAERLNAEIVNADSRQVYRGMDIGTAKPSAEDRRRVPHHLIDVRAPDEPLDVAGFSRARARGDRGSRVARPQRDGGWRQRLLSDACCAAEFSAGRRRRPRFAASSRRSPPSAGCEYLHARLAEVDAPSAERIGHRDLYRIVRALEVFRLTGLPMSAHQQRHRFAAREYETLTVGLAMARERLYEAIDRRFDEMVARGLVE